MLPARVGKGKNGNEKETKQKKWRFGDWKIPENV